MKKYRSDKEWRALFGEQERSGMNAKRFCREKGVCANAYYQKKKSLTGGGGLVRLPMISAGATAVELRVGGITIEVRNGFPERELVRVLRCVREAMDA